VLGLLVLLALLLVAVLAQTAGSYDLRWWTADTSRSQLEAGSYTLRSGFGQPASAATPDRQRLYLPLVRKE
jgi:hypothetical protein